MPGWSSRCVDEAGPSVSQSRNAHMTCLSGVTSMSWTPLISLLLSLISWSVFLEHRFDGMHQLSNGKRLLEEMV